jgi:hypothetical protein
MQHNSLCFISALGWFELIVLNCNNIPQNFKYKILINVRTKLFVITTLLQGSECVSFLHYCKDLIVRANYITVRT